MKTALEQIRTAAVSALDSLKDMKELENLRVKFLGKKGELTSILKQMGKLSAEERPIIGQLANEVRAQIEEAITSRQQSLMEAEINERLTAEKIDVT
ncbi:MAG: pheS, partial [Oscillospiraceae bacterium]|nr:pheS [Oscillospiraceae bacterium]